VASATISFREGVIAKLPNGYRPKKGLPNFRDVLTALGNSEMYRFYQEGSEYVHGGMYASRSYSKNLGTRRSLGDFTDTLDWILPMRLCFLSFGEAAKFILDRLGVPPSAMPDWEAINRSSDAAFQALAAHAARAYGMTEDISLIADRDRSRSARFMALRMIASTAHSIQCARAFDHSR
jgi:hypothetical protein